MGITISKSDQMEFKVVVKSQTAWVKMWPLPLYYLNQVSFTFCVPQFSHL